MGIWNMKLCVRLVPLVVPLLVSVGRTSCAQETLSVKCIPGVVRQGDVCLVIASGPESVESVYGEFQAEEFPMAFLARNGTFRGLLGIDRNTNPGSYKLRVIATDAGQKLLTEVSTIRVEKVDFGIQRLTLPPSQVDLDPETLGRVKKEAMRLKTLLKSYRDERLWKGAFIRPVEGEVSSGFGVRRILNGQERSPHTGVDLAAPEGTPARASNSGVVVLADELFFSGLMIVLDHGWGTYSMYSHLSKALVHQGDTVSKGDILALTGSTGRVTGPHLDWRIRLNGVRVDPLSILQLAEYLEE